jgi:hypothetical protein
VYEELRSLNRAKDIIQPSSLRRPEVLWAMVRFDPFSHEYSKIKNVSVGEFIERVATPSTPDGDPRLMRDAAEGVHTANFNVGGQEHKVQLTEAHLQLRRYIEEIPARHHPEVRKLKISELATVLEQREA